MDTSYHGFSKPSHLQTQVLSIQHLLSSKKLMYGCCSPGGDRHTIYAKLPYKAGKRQSRDKADRKQGELEVIWTGGVKVAEKQEVLRNDWWYKGQRRKQGRWWKDSMREQEGWESHKGSQALGMQRMVLGSPAPLSFLLWGSQSPLLLFMDSRELLTFFSNTTQQRWKQRARHK